jgi:hypothetical protein
MVIDKMNDFVFTLDFPFAAISVKSEKGSGCFFLFFDANLIHILLNRQD